jgi:hypothetical protein
MAQHETRTYRVTTSHPTLWQDGVHEFRVSTTTGYSGVPDAPLVWYAVAHPFGCGKNYMTPELAIRALCADHACTVTRMERTDNVPPPPPPADPAIARRMRDERRIARLIVLDAIAAGYSVSVNDGADLTVRASRNADAIVAALQTTDEDYLLIHDRDASEEPFGWVRLIYGNGDGSEVVNDSTTNLDSILARATRLADAIAERGR